MNNMAETFNAYIVHATAECIIYMFVDIRVALMERIVIKRPLTATIEDLICPRIRTMLEKEREKSRNCFPLPSSNMTFKVAHKLELNTC